MDGPPSTETFFSSLLSGEKNPIERLSGEKNGEPADVTPGTARASS
jgi:hypothetical protein